MADEFVVAAEWQLAPVRYFVICEARAHANVELPVVDCTPGQALARQVTSESHPTAYATITDVRHYLHICAKPLLTIPNLRVELGNVDSV